MKTKFEIAASTWLPDENWSIRDGVLVDSPRVVAPAEWEAALAAAESVAAQQLNIVAWVNPFSIR